jgi:hypothetical protein
MIANVAVRRERGSAVGCYIACPIQIIGRTAACQHFCMACYKIGPLWQNEADRAASNRDEARCRAQQVFCAAGYEGTTLAALQEAMGGITAPSFYAAFRSSEELFREVIERYMKTEGVGPSRALSENATARSRIAAMSVAAVESFSQP